MSNSLRVVVLIASHLNTHERHETIKYALESVRDGTRKPDHVYISCSYQDQVPDILAWSGILAYIDHTILIQNKRLLQFEHYNILSKRVQDDDIICFLDDDDLYHPNKIQKVHTHFSLFPNTQVIHHRWCIFGFLEPALTTKSVKQIKDTQLGSVEEYWSKSVKGWLFKDWFINTGQYTEGLTFEQIIERYKGLTDTVFTVSLPQSVLFTLDVLMYMRKEAISRDYG